MSIKRTFATVLATAGLLAAAACGGDSDTFSGSDGATTDKGSLTLVAQAFTENRIVAQLYAQVLEADGYDVTVQEVATRDLYVKSLENNDVQLVPEYVAGIADFLNTAKNGPDAEPVTTNDAQESLAALKPLADEAGISLLEPSEATDQNAFFVTQELAEQNDLTTLSDLAALNMPIVLAAPEDCKGRSDCEGGLAGVYGMDITKIIPLKFASTQAKDAVSSGEAQLGETGTTDGSLDQLGLVLLEDDKGIQPAQNLIPAVNTEFLDAHPDLADTLNEVSATLTTEDLAAMNLQVDLERQKTEDVAAAYLADNGLV